MESPSSNIKNIFKRIKFDAGTVPHIKRGIQVINAIANSTIYYTIPCYRLDHKYFTQWLLYSSLPINIYFLFPANMNSLKKRTAPAPPPGTSSSSSNFYGTLPHPPRHSQNFDTNDIRTHNHKNQSMDAASYGTLPLLRSVDSSPRIMGGHNTSATHGGFYERLDKIVSQDPNGGPSGHHIIPAMTTFGHKRSPSGESLNRNLHLAGAKLVLPPAGEIPTLKHVDKSALSRPKIPPPGPPAG